MDPAEDLPPPPAFFPPPAPAAVAPSPIPAAASLSGPKIFFLSSLRATSTTSIGIFTPLRLMSRRGTTRLFFLSPLTTAILSPSTNVPISLSFNLLTLWQSFAPFPRSLLPFFDEVTGFSLSREPPLLLYPVVRCRLPFFPMLLLRVLLGVMTLPRSWLQPRRLLPPSPAMIFFPPPLVALILTGSMALLLSSGEWRERGAFASLVALPPLCSSTSCAQSSCDCICGICVCICCFADASFVSRGSVCFFGVRPYHVFPGSKQPSGGGSISPFSTSSWRLDSCPGSFFFSVGPLSHYGSSLAFGAFQATCHQGCQNLFGCARHGPVLSS